MAKHNPAARSDPARDTALPVDPLWYKDAIFYQLHVRSFFDSDDDGVGDFEGLTQKLDYLQDLGVTALWLLPFYPSPLRDDGYDIASYTEVNPAYGNLRAFRRFVHEAHARGLRVITELVLNHTSDQHPWFQRSRLAKAGSADRDFYVWSDTQEKYQDARIIFKDFEVSNWTWDPLVKAYYWHRFYSHQPDLNFENPRVRQAMFEVLDYWLRLGVDGLRLDAVPYLYESEGTNCENLPETHAFLKQLRSHVDERFPGRMLLAEANQWPEDAISYFGDGDECQTAFHFPVMPRLFMAVHMEERHPIVDILQQTPPIPANCQWVVFLRNHDELTLEMVTDEERDYMYRVYARDRQARINLGIRRRLAPLLGNNRRKIELMNGLLCSLPGTPVIYYGDEIGMGDNIYLGDRHGVRTPMQWSPDRNAGFSKANPQRLYSPVIIDSEYLFEAVNVETQQKNPHSLLWWMKRLIALRQQSPALSRGRLELLSPENPKILAFTRDLPDQSVLVVANMSRFVQFVELDLSRFAGRRPVEMFGQTRFPPVTKAPYFFSLSPHAFYWLTFESEAVETSQSPKSRADIPKLNIHENLEDLLRGRSKKQFETLISQEMIRRRWVGNGGRTLQAAHIVDGIPLGKPTERALPWITLFRLDYLEGESETHLRPFLSAWGQEAQRLVDKSAAPPIGQLHKSAPRESGMLLDATSEPTTTAALLKMMVRRGRLKGLHGELVGWSTPVLRQMAKELSGVVAPSPNGSDQANSTTVFGEKVIFKLFHQVEAGVNPELEIGHFLDRNRAKFPHTPRLLGSLEYQPENGSEGITVAVSHEYLPGTVTGWQFAQDTLGRLFEQAIGQPVAAHKRIELPPGASVLAAATGDIPADVKDLLGNSLEWAALLGQRTAELHLALASDHDNSAFAPEPFTQLYQRSLYQSSRKLALRVFHALRPKLSSFTEEQQAVGSQVLEREKQVLETIRALVGQKIVGQRIRGHGNYHLGHVLYSGKDFFVIDFGGEQGKSFPVRRLKRPPLDDVASMIESFHAAASQTLLRMPKTGFATADALAAARQVADLWAHWSASAFLRAYMTSVSTADLLPASTAHVELLLTILLMEKSFFQVERTLATEAERLAGALQSLAKFSRV